MTECAVSAGKASEPRSGVLDSKLAAALAARVKTANGQAYEFLDSDR
jgi:hypothetical protein